MPLVGPAGVEEGLLALWLGAVVFEGLSEVESFLEPDLVLGHGGWAGLYVLLSKEIR